MERSNSCDYGFGPCTAPDTLCPHWMGIFCEFDTAEYKVRKCIEAMDEIDQYVKEHPEVPQINIGRQQEFLDNQKSKTKLVIKSDKL